MGKIFDWIFQKEADTGEPQEFTDDSEKVETKEGDYRIQTKFNHVKNWYDWRILNPYGLPISGSIGGFSSSGCEWTKETCIKKAQLYLEMVEKKKKSKNAQWEDV